MSRIYAIRHEDKIPFIQECQVIKVGRVWITLRERISGRSFNVYDYNRNKDKIKILSVSDDWGRGWYFHCHLDATKRLENYIEKLEDKAIKDLAYVADLHNRLNLIKRGRGWKI